MPKSLVALILGLLAFLGCATAVGDEGGSVPDSVTFSGTVVLDAPPAQSPAALPAGALLTVTLEDVSRADAPAVLLGQTQIQLDGQREPIPFALVYPGSAVQPQAVYAARARIGLGDRLLFTTTQSNRVDALNPVPLELRLQPVPSAPPVPSVQDVSLTETYWKLVAVDGAPVQVSEAMREPHLVLHGQDGRFAGSGGVNQLMGAFTVDGNSLTFGNAGMTMMAGPPEAMQQEQAIVGAFGRVGTFQIVADQLTLLDEAGLPVLQAVAVALN